MQAQVYSYWLCFRSLAILHMFLHRAALAPLLGTTRKTQQRLLRSFGCLSPHPTTTHSLDNLLNRARSLPANPAKSLVDAPSVDEANLVTWTRTNCFFPLYSSLSRARGELLASRKGFVLRFRFNRSKRERKKLPWHFALDLPAWLTALSKYFVRCFSCSAARANHATLQLAHRMRICSMRNIHKLSSSLSWLQLGFAGRCRYRGQRPHQRSHARPKGLHQTIKNSREWKPHRGSLLSRSACGHQMPS